MFKKKVLITGCSSGIGYLSALRFAREGWEVYACVRNLDSAGAKDLAAISEQEKLKINVMEMDVTSEAEVSTVFQKVGFVDVLINNAGYGNIGPVEDFTIEEIKDLYDVNVFGALRVAKAALPLMRKKKKGRIINISSINGLISFGLFGVYSSSKFALESLSEALRFELAPFGIDVVLIEPGVFETKFSENSKRPSKFTSKDTAYKKLEDPLRRKTTQKLKEVGFLKKLIDPQKVADKILYAAAVEIPRMRYIVGFDAYLYLFARKILPYKLWLLLLRRAYKW